MEKIGVKQFKVQKWWDKYKHVVNIGAILFVITFLFLFIIKGNINLGPYRLNYTVLETQFDSIDFYAEGQEIEQTFESLSKILNGLQIEFEVGDIVNRGIIQVEVMQVGTNELVYDGSIEMSILSKKHTIPLYFENEIADALGEEFKITLRVAKTSASNNLKLVLGVGVPDILELEIEDIQLSEADFDDSKDRFVLVSFGERYGFIDNYIKILFIAIEIFAILMYCLIFIKKAKIETVFLVAAIFAGFIYSFMITPYGSPDESAHIDTTYQYSNSLLGIESAGENLIYKRSCDIYNTFLEHQSLATWKALNNQIFAETGDTTLEAIESTATTANPILHAPAILGITLARIMNLNTVWLLMIGSWCSLIAYALLVYFGMKRLPFGKSLLFVIALLPMSIQQAVSFSYDSIINGVALLFTCYFLYFMFNRVKISKKNIITLMILSFIIALGKSGVYLPLIFMLLLLPMQKKDQMPKKKLWFISLGIIGVTVLMCLSYNLPSILGDFSGGSDSGEKIISWAHEPGYTVNYIFQNLKKVAFVFTNTFFVKAQYYLSTFVGESLGQFDIQVSPIYISIFWILLFGASIREEHEAQMFTKIQRVFIGILCFGSVFLILFSMFFYWTPISRAIIMGVQGRYFIPLSFILLLLFRCSIISWKRSVEKKIVYATCFLQMLVMVEIIRAILLNTRPI